jgi:hypothetical protein
MNVEAVVDLVNLVVLLCSLVNPNACAEKRFALDTDGSLKACMIQAQPYLAHYIGDHPDQRVAGWRCVYPDQDKKQI